jgi:hypothetical protein
MEFLSDLFLGSAAIGAAIYCFVLSRRLAALRSLEGGMGNAIAVLSSQVDDLGRMLTATRDAAGTAGTRLDTQTERAEAAARRLELLVASMHDLPQAQESRPPSRWPVSDAHPPQSEPGDPAARARILRRRQAPESR